MPQTSKEHRVNASTPRIPQRLVNDRIAETVKSIREHYNTKRTKRSKGSKARQGLLF